MCISVTAVYFCLFVLCAYFPGRFNTSEQELLRLPKARIGHPTPPPSYSTQPRAKNSSALLLPQEPFLRTNGGQCIPWLSWLSSANSNPVSCMPTGWQECATLPVQEGGGAGHHWEGASVERTQDVPTPADPTWPICEERALTSSTKAPLCGIEQAPSLSKALSSLLKGWQDILESSEGK